MKRALIAVTLFAASSAGAQTPVSMKNVDLQATLQPKSREIDAVIRVGIATPIGRIPVSGHGQLKYSCDGAFSGSMSYNRVIRFFAKLKGIALVTALDGKMITADPINCESAVARKLVGRADVDSTVMKGWFKVGADSTVFSGPAWTFADSTYHSILAARMADKPLTLHINMYKHPRMMKAARK